jgi:hypothetical protein
VVNSARMGYDCPMKDAISYLKTLSLMLEARKHGNGVREDRFLDELDIIWMKLSKREVALIDRISMFIARDILTLSNLKNLITRLEHKYSGPIVAVRVYLGKSNKRSVSKKPRPSVFRLASPAEVERRSSARLARDVASAP